MLDMLSLLFCKAFRYRIYPTATQEARLIAWSKTLRFLWNLAHEQRLMGLARTDKRFPTAFDQINELTLLRAELPWLAAVPRDVAAQLLVELDRSWQRYFKRQTRMPRFKSRGDRDPVLMEPHPKMWRMRGHAVRFPKIGDLRMVLHRQLVGKPKTCALHRDGDQWFVSIVCHIDIPDPASRYEPVIAIDRGIVNLLADSDGNLTSNPRYLKQSQKRLAHANRVVSRRKKGSKNREKAKLRMMRLHRKVRRQREHFLHVESARLVKSHGVVVIEKLNVAGMMRNTNLSGSIADCGWPRFAEMLRYKLAWSGGTLIEVPAHYSSQTCAACGHVDARSRRGERFCCTACGHVDHADVNAAKVLLTRANRSGLPMEGSALEAARRSGKVVEGLRKVRRSSSQGHSSG